MQGESRPNAVYSYPLAFRIAPHQPYLKAGPVSKFPPILDTLRGNDRTLAVTTNQNDGVFTYLRTNDRQRVEIHISVPKGRKGAVTLHTGCTTTTLQ